MDSMARGAVADVVGDFHAVCVTCLRYSLAVRGQPFSEVRSALSEKMPLFQKWPACVAAVTGPLADRLAPLLQTSVEDLWPPVEDQCWDLGYINDLTKLYSGEGPDAKGYDFGFSVEYRKVLFGVFLRKLTQLTHGVLWLRCEARGLHWGDTPILIKRLLAEIWRALPRDDLPASLDNVLVALLSQWLDSDAVRRCDPRDAEGPAFTQTVSEVSRAVCWENGKGDNS